MKKDYTRIVKTLFEAGSLRKIARSHMQLFYSADLSDNIASHSYRVSVIGYFLAKLEKANTEKVLTMCLFHDFSEARSGDQNWVHKRYVKVFEDEILNDQFKDIVANNELFTTMAEYNERESKESKIAKDADSLDQILLLKEYEVQGNTEAKAWMKGRELEKKLFSETAKKLCLQIYVMQPHEWWKNLWTSNRR